MGPIFAEPTDTTNQYIADLTDLLSLKLFTLTKSNALDIIYPEGRVILRPNGNAALMHHLVMAGVGIDAFRGDNLGIGVNWGGPTDRTRRDQYSLELYYAIQRTQHVNIMPDIQLTMNPSFNDTHDLVAIFSTIRIRYAM